METDSTSTFWLIMVASGALAFLWKFIKVMRGEDSTTKKLTPEEQKLQDLLSRYIADDHLDVQKAKAILEYTLSAGINIFTFRAFATKAFSSVYDKIAEDGRITDDETKRIEDFINQLEVKPDDIGFNQLSFNRLHILWLLDQGELPAIKHGLTFALNEGENITWAEGAVQLKKKKRTERVNYGGVTHTVNLGYGFKLRAGSIKVKPVVRETLEQEAVGIIWLSNQRIGFESDSIKWQMKLKDIHTAEIDDGHFVSIHKKNRKTPELVYLEDAQVVAKLLDILVFNPIDSTEKKAAS